MVVPSARTTRTVAGGSLRIPLTIVRGSAGELALDPSFRSGLEWPVETKRALIDRGRHLADEMLGKRS